MRGLVLILVGVLLGGCGLGEAGTGLAHQRDGEIYPGDRGQLTGRVEGGPACWHIALDGQSYFIIWPAGTEDGIVGEEWGARLSKGEIVAPGDTVTGTGAFTPTRPLVADRYGYWAHVIGMCAPDAREVVVFDTVRRAPETSAAAEHENGWPGALGSFTHTRTCQHQVAGLSRHEENARCREPGGYMR